MTKTVWMRPAANTVTPQGVDVTRCAICGGATRGRGAVLEVVTDKGTHVFQAICDRDAANPSAVTNVIRDMKRPALPRI